MRNYGIFLIIAAMVVSGCASTGGPQNSVAQLQQIGEKYLAAGDTPSALKYLTEAESKRPDDPTIQYDLGLAYHQRGMTDEAIVRFRKALQARPNYSEAQNALGVVYAERGQLDQARDSFQKALADPFYQTPQLPSYNLGRIHEKKGELDAALTEYERTLRFQPSYGAAWYRIGQIMEERNRGDEARNAYGRAIAVSSEMPEAHLRYGVMSYQAGHFESALFSLNRVMKLAPNTTMADEAKLFLDRIRGTAQSGRNTSASRSEAAAAGVEFITGENPEQNRRQTRAQPPSPKVLSFPPDSLIITPNSKQPEIAVIPPQNQTGPKPEISFQREAMISGSEPPVAESGRSDVHLREVYTPRPGKSLDSYAGPVVLQGQGASVAVVPGKAPSSQEGRTAVEHQEAIGASSTAAEEEKNRDPGNNRGETGVMPSGPTSVALGTLFADPPREMPEPRNAAKPEESTIPSTALETAAFPSATGPSTPPAEKNPIVESGKETAPASPIVSAEDKGEEVPAQSGDISAPDSFTALEDHKDSPAGVKSGPVPAGNKDKPGAAEKSDANTAAATIQPPLDQSVSVPAIPRYAYVVQLGSFTEKEKAEEIRGRLVSSGYSAMVKRTRVKGVGTVFVVQLKPEPTFSKANTLMIQMGSQAPGKPLILKVPAEGNTGSGAR